jgi:hypothetical protein
MKDNELILSKRFKPTYRPLKGYLRDNLYKKNTAQYKGLSAYNLLIKVFLLIVMSFFQQDHLVYWSNQN